MIFPGITSIGIIPLTTYRRVLENDRKKRQMPQPADIEECRTQRLTIFLTTFLTTYRSFSLIILKNLRIVTGNFQILYHTCRRSGGF